MKKSLQQIEDFYQSKGYKEERLRTALAKDKEYQSILKDRKNRLTQKFKVTNKEKKIYVLSTDKDYGILAKCKELEKLKISKEDRLLIKIIKSQLEDDWRGHLLKKLNKLLQKYKK